ncbi:MAG: alpha/beta hydrolase [Prevotella sp.]|jgi:pimeloyl-ACP methyl ester carboxylesterase|nr:alpha/beta hydrolase [Prevotella sp.]
MSKHIRILFIIFLSVHIYSCTQKTEKQEWTVTQDGEMQWNGYICHNFYYDGRKTLVVIPKEPAKGNPWIWRPAFFGAYPSVDMALLNKGFHVVFYDVAHSYGNPKAVASGTNLYNFLANHYQLSPKVTLEGFSRGGLYAFNWAAKNTDKVACMYVDAPVCNVFSWPSRKQQDLWANLLNEWELTDEEMNDFKDNPIDNLSVLAKANIPIIAVCGDSDDVVPYKENMEIVYSRYLELGGIVEVILKEGIGHHPHSLENPEQIVDFILKYQSYN